MRMLYLGLLSILRSILKKSLLHEAKEKNKEATLVELKKTFSAEVDELVKRVAVMTTIYPDEPCSELDKKAVLIKLADRLHNMRTIKFMEPMRAREKAKETIEFFSPIAAKLEISKMKTELDELALRYL